MIQFRQFLLEALTVADSIGDLVTHYHSMRPKPNIQTTRRTQYVHPTIKGVRTMLRQKKFGVMNAEILYKGRSLGKNSLPHMFAHGLGVFAHHLESNPKVKGIHFLGLTTTHNRLYNRLRKHFEQGDFASHPVLGKFMLHHEDIPIIDSSGKVGILYRKYIMSRKDDPAQLDRIGSQDAPV